MIGGKLCDILVDQSNDDVFTLGDNVYRGIYVDKHNPNVLIKIIQDKNEYILSKLLEHNDFIPKVYGYYKCKKYISVPKYTLEQQRIKAYNMYHPNDQRDLGEIKYDNSREDFPQYLVMERIRGDTLVNLNIDTIKNYIDEIYRLYNILADKGFILEDLAARNIIISHTGKVYFIDFDPELTNNTLNSIPISKRLSKEKLEKILIDELKEEQLNFKRGGKTKNKTKKTNKKYTNRKLKYKKYKKTINRKLNYKNRK
jgi:hypothetical protein